MIARRRERTYVVLVERVVDTDVNDRVFVLVGYYDAPTPTVAARDARRQHSDVLADEELVVVAGSAFRPVDP